MKKIAIYGVIAVLIAGAIGYFCLKTEMVRANACRPSGRFRPASFRVGQSGGGGKSGLVF